MRRPIKLADRLRYAVDSTFARGSGTLVFWPFVLSAVIVLLAAILAALLVSNDGINPRNTEQACPFFAGPDVPFVESQDPICQSWVRPKTLGFMPMVDDLLGAATLLGPDTP